MNKGLGSKILNLRDKGYTYNQIVKELGCSKGTVSFHCGTGQKDKAKSRKFLSNINYVERNNADRAFLRELSMRYKKLCGCKVCGERDPIVLQFDHKEPAEKITTISQMIGDRYSLKLFKEEIRKCNVLCANCHIRRTTQQFNYHSHYRKSIL